MSILRPAVLLVSLLLVTSAADISAQHIFLDECDRAHQWQPKSCYID